MSDTGALILMFFAALWWLVGLRAAGHGPVLVYPLPLALLAAVALAVRRRARAGPAGPDPAAARRGRLVGWASAGEGLAILVAVNVLARTGHLDATAPVVAMIVGAHFLPLARGLPAPAYYATAVALLGVGVVGLQVAEPSARLTVVSVGAAATLWTSAAVTLRRAWKPRQAAARAPAP